MKMHFTTTIKRFFLLISIVGFVSSLYGQEYVRSYSLNSLTNGQVLMIDFPLSDIGGDYNISTELIYSKTQNTDIEGTAFEAIVSYTLGEVSNHISLEGNGQLSLQYTSGQRSKEREKKKYVGDSTNLVLTIDSIQKPNGMIPDDVYLNIYLSLKDHNRQKYFLTDLETSFLSYDYNRRLLMAGHNPYAVGYEFEWVFVDELASSSLKPQGNSQFDKVNNAFELYQGINIRLNEPFYDFDPILPRGKVYFRVRPILKHIDSDLDLVGAWHYQDEQNDFQILTIDETKAFQKEKNWSYQRTYAEHGLEKTMVIYADALGNGRQLKTNLNTDENIVIAESFYDYEGRASTSPLPFPMTETEAITGNKHALSYLVNANVYQDSTRDKIHYDKSSGSDPLANISGAAKYFSSANNVGGIHRNAIPEANGFVVSQTHFKKDHTGRAIEAGNVGEAFSLTKTGSESHTTKIYYLEPTQEELASLFGSNVGDAKRYRKEVTVDANGQASATYRNAAGQVIATGLMGDSPNNLVALASNIDKPATKKTITIDPISQGKASNSSHKLLNIAGPQTVELSYEFTGSNDLLEGGICLACSYDLTIEVISPSGEKVLLSYLDGGNTVESEQIIKEYAGNDLFSCGVWVKETIDFSAYFGEIGEYTINKNLVARDINIQDVVDAVTANNGTIATLISNGDLSTKEDLKNSIAATTDFSQCEQDCNERCRVYVLNDLGLTETQAVGNTLFEEALEECQEGNCDVDIYTDLAYKESCNSLLSRMANQFENGGVYFPNFSNNSNMTVSGQGVAPDNISNFETTMNTILDSERLLLTEGELLVFNPPSGTVFQDAFWEATQGFKSNWTETFALNHHPEIKHYELCQLKATKLEDLNNSANNNEYSFDSYGQAMMSIETFEEAVEQGFIDPLLIGTHETHIISNYLDNNSPYLVNGQIADNLDPLLSDLLLAEVNCQQSNQDIITQFQNDFMNYTSGLETFDATTGNAQTNNLVIQSIWTMFEDFDQVSSSINPLTPDEIWQKFRASYLSFREERFEHFKTGACFDLLNPEDDLYLNESFAVVTKIDTKDFENILEQNEETSKAINALNAEYSAVAITDDLLQDCQVFHGMNSLDPNDPEYELTTAQEDHRVIIEGYLKSYLEISVDHNPLQLILTEDLTTDASLVALQTYLTQNFSTCSTLGDIAFVEAYKEVCTQVEIPTAFENNACNEEYRLDKLTEVLNLINDYMKNPVAYNQSVSIDVNSNAIIAVQIKTISDEINLTINGQNLSTSQIISAPTGTNGSVFYWPYNVNGVSYLGDWKDVSHIDEVIEQNGNLVMYYTNSNQGNGSKVLTNTTTSAPTNGLCSNPLSTVCYQTLNEDCGCAEKVISELANLNLGQTTSIVKSSNEAFAQDLVAVFNEYIDLLNDPNTPSQFNFFLYDQVPSGMTLYNSNWPSYYSSVDLDYARWNLSITGTFTPYIFEQGFSGSNFSALGTLQNPPSNNYRTTPSFLVSVANSTVLSTDFTTIKSLELKQPFDFTSTDFRVIVHYNDPNTPSEEAVFSAPFNVPNQVAISSCSNQGYTNIEHTPSTDYLTINNGTTTPLQVYFYNKNGMALDPSKIQATYAVFDEQNSPVSVLANGLIYAGKVLEIDYLDNNNIEQSDFFYLYANTPNEAFFSSCYFPDFEEVTLTEETLKNACLASIDEKITEQAELDYQNKLAAVLTEQLDETQANCIQNAEESFTYKMVEKRYHYTLYYYDQSGSLVQTVPPEGVDEVEVLPSDFITVVIPETGEKVKQYIGTEPDHTLATQYSYNNVGHLLTSHTPDGGDRKFWYDDKFRIRLSQNAQQVKESNNTPGNNQYAYTKYDYLSRPIESGELLDLEASYATLLNDVATHTGTTAQQAQNLENVFALLNQHGFPDKNDNEVDYSLKEITQTVYTDAYGPFGVDQQHTRNRVTAAITKPDRNSSEVSVMMYSYDIHGNVEDYWSYLEGLGLTHVNYEYDLISGNALKVNYNEGEVDQFFHQYSYDADNRLISVETSSNDEYYQEDAHYYYYAHGPLARVELGDQGVQGCDYYYNLQGWLKGINTPDELDGNGSTQTDLGNDGLVGTYGNSKNKYIAKDEFAMALAYYKGDYQSIGNMDLGAANKNLWEDYSLAGNLYDSDVTPGKSYGLYNGNIASMIHQVHRLGELKNNEYAANNNGAQGNYTTNFGMRAQVFTYDQLQRIKATRSYENYNGAFWAARVDGSQEAYDVDYEYDANGNITHLKRWGKDAVVIDDLTYQYERNSNPKLLHNRLLSVHDAQGRQETNDLRTLAGDYTYDEIGNLVKDGDLLGGDVEGLEVEWRLDGKVESISLYQRTISFAYDALGNRIRKYEVNSTGQKTGYYVKDATGNVLANYESFDPHAPGDYTYFDLTEHPIYGSARHGVNKERIQVRDLTNPEQKVILGTVTTCSYSTGDRLYEESNHLGNVMVVLSDLKMGVDTDSDGKLNYYQSDIVSASDYYPFGWGIEDRSYSSLSYRYGFNGMEKDDEIKGNGNSYTTHFRQYDSRIGRWLSIDPVVHPWESSYVAFHNNPIYFTDPRGDDPPDASGWYSVIERGTNKKIYVHWHKGESVELPSGKYYWGKRLHSVPMTGGDLYAENMDGLLKLLDMKDNPQKYKRLAEESRKRHEKEEKDNSQAQVNQAKDIIQNAGDAIAPFEATEDVLSNKENLRKALHEATKYVKKKTGYKIKPGGNTFKNVNNVVNKADGVRNLGRALTVIDAGLLATDVIVNNEIKPSHVYEAQVIASVEGATALLTPLGGIALATSISQIEMASQFVFDKSVSDVLDENISWRIPLPNGIKLW